ncbi:tRNA 2-selenouridine synthase [Campylobacter concisus]
MKKVKFIVFICLFILLPLAYFNGFIRISDLTSEQESIAKKYGGVYVFDEKLEKEIDKREGERDKYLDDFFKNNNRDFDLNDQAIMNEKLPRVLSNGKKYYVTTRDYGNDFKKQAWIPREYSEKINEFIGKENLEKIKVSKLLSYFYADNDNGDIVPIVVSVYYNVPTIVFGLYGDEASGIKFYKTIFNDVGGDDYFYLIDNKFQKISNKSKDK